MAEDLSDAKAVADEYMTDVAAFDQGMLTETNRRMLAYSLRSEQLTPDEWCARYGLEIADPDGWRGRDAPPWDQPIGLVEFAERYAQCTARDVTADRELFERDVKAARGE
jgi:hypothetical protein